MISDIAGGVHAVLAFGFTLYVLTRRREPANTLAWILGFFLFPFLGVFLYMLFGFQRYRRRRKAKPHPRAEPEAGAARLTRFNVPEALQSEVSHLARLSERLTGFAPHSGSRAEVFLDPESSLRALRDAIEAARHHAHLAFYIVRDDPAGRVIADALIAARQRGVQCRFMIDAVGGLPLRGSFLGRLRKAGVEVRFFSPLRRFKRLWHLHLRNHRKLAVIDGTTGFIGSQNLLDNYSAVPAEDRLWLESALRVQGPVVRDLQAIFAEDWRYTTGDKLSAAAYFPDPPAAGDQQIQAVPTGPDLPEQTLHLLFLGMLHAAQDSVTLVTPYLVPSLPISLALEGAARRGVRVAVLLPRRSDNLLARWAGRSWYPSLLEAGVQIYEHPHTPVHAKAILIDRHIAFMGSANLDVRSFELNFEAGILLYGASPAARLQEQAEAAMRRAQRLHPGDWKRRGPVAPVMEGLARLLSPLL